MLQVDLAPQGHQDGWIHLRILVGTEATLGQDRTDFNYD